MASCASTVTDSRKRKDAAKAAHASGRAKWRVKDMLMLRNVVCAEARAELNRS